MMKDSLIRIATPRYSIYSDLPQKLNQSKKYYEKEKSNVIQLFLFIAVAGFIDRGRMTPTMTSPVRGGPRGVSAPGGTPGAPPGANPQSATLSPILGSPVNAGGAPNNQMEVVGAGAACMSQIFARKLAESGLFE